MEKRFLAKINIDDRDCVKYIEVKGFEYGHYFGGVNLCGSCFSGFVEDFVNTVNNDYDSMTTILTKEELLKIFSLHKDLKDLGYGIVEGSDDYNKGIKILDEINTIVDKLDSKENKELFDKVVEDEKQYCMDTYDITKEDVNYIFDNYNNDYQDRGIISCVFEDRDELIDEEKYQMGYNNIPYFDDDAFGDDLLDSEDYLELSDGKIVSLSY